MRVCISFSFVCAFGFFVQHLIAPCTYLPLAALPVVQRLRGEMFELVTRLTMTFDYEKGRFVIAGDGNWVGLRVLRSTQYAVPSTQCPVPSSTQSPVPSSTQSTAPNTNYTTLRWCTRSGVVKLCSM